MRNSGQTKFPSALCIVPDKTESLQMPSFVVARNLKRFEINHALNFTMPLPLHYLNTERDFLNCKLHLNFNVTGDMNSTRQPRGVYCLSRRRPAGSPPRVRLSRPEAALDPSWQCSYVALGPATGPQMPGGCPPHDATAGPALPHPRPTTLTFLPAP